MTHEERMYLTYLKYPRMRPEGWKPSNTAIQDLPPEPDVNGDTCPICGSETLIHESGCVKCSSCLWSACG